MTKKKNHYIDNEQFLIEIEKYVNLYNSKGEDEKPRMPDRLGKYFLDIAENLAKARNFSYYKFKEEMISDGYFDCIRYAHKFDSNKTKNPFGFFTMVCFNAFIRKIKKEKRALYTKYKVIANSEIFGLLADMGDSEITSAINDIGYGEAARDNMYQFIREYEEKLEKDVEANNAKD